MTPDTATAISTALGIGSLLILLAMACYLERKMRQ